MLGGPGMVVEFDETDISKKQKYGRGAASSTDKWCFGIVERLPNGGRGRFRFWRVPNRRKRILYHIINNEVRRGT